MLCTEKNPSGSCMEGHSSVTINILNPEQPEGLGWL